MKYILGQQVEVNYKGGHKQIQHSVGVVIALPNPEGSFPDDYEVRYYKDDGKVADGLFKPSEIDYLMPSKPHRMRSVYKPMPPMSKVIRLQPLGTNARLLQLINEGQARSKHRYYAGKPNRAMTIKARPEAQVAINEAHAAFPAWIQWQGTPFHSPTYKLPWGLGGYEHVLIVCRNGQEYSGRADSFEWQHVSVGHKLNGYDIVQYRRTHVVQ